MPPPAALAAAGAAPEAGVAAAAAWAGGAVVAAGLAGAAVGCAAGAEPEQPANTNARTLSANAGARAATPSAPGLYFDIDSSSLSGAAVPCVAALADTPRCARRGAPYHTPSSPRA